MQFRLTGQALGLSASALSNAREGLEERLGVQPVSRTNRSVTHGAAGEELLAAPGDPFAAMLAAEDGLNFCDNSSVGAALSPLWCRWTGLRLHGYL